MKITKKQLRKLIEVYVVTPDGEAHDAKKRYKDSLETKIKQTDPGLERLMDKITDQHGEIGRHTFPRNQYSTEAYSDVISQPYALYSSLTDDDVEGAILDHETEHPERGMHYDPYLKTDIENARVAVYNLASEIDMMGLGLDYEEFRGWNPPPGYPDVAESIINSLVNNSFNKWMFESLSGDYINNDVFMKRYAGNLYKSPVAQKTFVDIIRRAHKAWNSKK